MSVSTKNKLFVVSAKICSVPSAIPYKDPLGAAQLNQSLFKWSSSSSLGIGGNAHWADFIFKITSMNAWWLKKYSHTLRFEAHLPIFTKGYGNQITQIK